jgi:hypothetical protein
MSVYMQGHPKTAKQTSVMVIKTNLAGHKTLFVDGCEFIDDIEKKFSDALEKQYKDGRALISTVQDDKGTRYIFSRSKPL